MLSCEEVLVALRDVLDDDAAEEMRRRLLAHLDQCRNCTALYDSVKQTIRLTTEGGCFEVPEDLSKRILDRISAEDDPEDDPVPTSH